MRSTLWLINCVDAGAVAMGKDAGAAERLMPLLASLSENPGTAGPCLARACAQLKLKRHLKADKVAAAMQHIISAEGGTSNCFW